MRPLRETLGLSDPPSPGLLQVIDALILFDSPILDQRFQEAIAMHPDAKMRAALAALPPRVAHGSRLTRRAGVAWERATGHSALDDAFRERAELFLLHAFLDSAEAQIRLKTFMSAHAPTREVRDEIDAAIGVHRELTGALRDAIDRLGGPPPGGGEAAPVGVEDDARDLRTQVEAAIRAMCGEGKRAREVVLSANALRRLRDQGAFPAGEVTLLGVPVQVDFSWHGSTFAVLSYDAAPLDEIVKS